MKRLAALALALSVAAFAVACDDDDNPTGPDNDVTLTAQLLPANEVPPVTGAEASGSGNVSITLHLTRNGAGTITAATADFNVALTGFPNNTPLTMAHIHNNVAGQTGPIVVDTGLAPGQVVLANGAGNFSRAGVAVSNVNLTDLQNIINNPSQFYFNVHSVANPNGVARGQLVIQ